MARVAFEGFDQDSGGYYNALVVAAAPGELPPGGAPGQVLVKVGRADFDAVWATPYIEGEGGGGTGPGPGGDITLDSVAPIRVQGGGSAWVISIDAASQLRPGSMSAADKRRLDNLPTWRGATAPAQALVGDLWFDTTLGRLFILHNDGSSTQWVDASPDGGGQGQGIYFGPQPPADPTAWGGWYDTTLGSTFLWFDDGSSSQWVPASPQGGGQNGDIDEGSYS